MNVGSNLPRLDGPAKLSGAAQYVDDLNMDGMLHGVTVRAAGPRGRITGVEFDPAVDWSQFVIVRAGDIPGPNQVQFIERDMPALAADEVRHPGEAVVLLAHPCLETARRAARAVRVVTEPLPAVLDPLTPLSPELVQHGPDNCFKKINITKGDPIPVFSRAAHVVQGEYLTGAQEHAYLEPQGMLAIPKPGGGLEVRGSMQCPYYVIKALMHLFGQPKEFFTVRQTATGGAFGGKEDYPSLLAIHAGLLALKASAPVKMVYERGEDMACTTKRHPAWVRHKTALDAGGRLLAMEIEIVMDGGAYMTLSPVVLSRGAIHAAGPYACDHVYIHAQARLTNTPPNGAFRGFGAPQTLFAIERHMDRCAQAVGITPEQIRRINLLREGQSTATGQVIRGEVELTGLMDRALADADYHARRRQYEEENRRHPWLRRGIGFAAFHHGAGFTGSGETLLSSQVHVAGLPDGRVEILVANTEMGQGTHTVLTQIAADRLGVGTGQIVIVNPDTDRVPDSGPTVASRTVMVVGRLIEQACDQLASKAGASGPALAEALRAWHACNPGGQLLGRAQYTKPEDIEWDDVTYRGQAYPTFAWAVYVADVEVDLRTFEVRVRDFVARQEVGRVINPVLARGQIQGGVTQAIGWALMEEVIRRQGAMINNQMTNYVIPSCGDIPPIRVFFEELPCAFGPQGAKGIGELPMDGGAPAVLNAVAQAVAGVDPCQIPLTPERLMDMVLTHEEEAGA